MASNKSYIASLVAWHMGKMGTCPCGFTVISPREDEVVKHIKLHLSEHHTGTVQTEAEIQKTLVTV
jgi:predicted small metal-binding protein